MPAKAKLLAERDFQKQVEDLADLYHWWHYHTHISIGSEEGYPDLHFWHPQVQRSFYAELKREDEEPADRQRNTIWSMRAAGLVVYVWWEHDLPEIQRVLSRTIPPANVIPTGPMGQGMKPIAPVGGLVVEGALIRLLHARRARRSRNKPRT